MAFAEQLTKLPLDRWAKLIGINPLHFNQVQGDARPPAVCASIWFQYEWQSADRVSREEVARAIAQAEHDIETTIGYRLLPSWEIDEWRRTSRGPAPELIRITPQDVRGFQQSVQARWGYVRSGGIRAKSLVVAGSAIAWTDVDGDGYTETGTVTVAVASGQAPSELHVYYPGISGADRYEIRPVNVSVGALVATITFRREQCVLLATLTDDLPAASDSFFRPVDGQVDANFLATVDVYRVYNDPQTQATMMWEPWGSSCGDCSGDGCVTCAYSVQTACLMLRSEPRNGWLSYTPAEWDAATLSFTDVGLANCRQPDMVRLWYYAGWRDESQGQPAVQMDPAWERAVAYYAAALLDRPVCECNNVHAFIENWRRDLAWTIKGENNIQVSPRDLDCPFGTKRGALFAWKRCLQEGARIAQVAMG